MGNVITIGVDLAKSVFQVHGVDAEGVIVVRRQLRRRQVLPFFEKLPPCLVGMEACATSHHWAREIEQFGHRVRLMPKPNKQDRSDLGPPVTQIGRHSPAFLDSPQTRDSFVLD